MKKNKLREARSKRFQEMLKASKKEEPVMEEVKKPKTKKVKEE